MIYIDNQTIINLLFSMEIWCVTILFVKQLKKITTLDIITAGVIS